MPAAPGTILDTSDPGADVQRRFRYQHAYAAIQCLGLLDENSDYIAVFCENHEDILLLRKDQKYVGVQVKTRDFDLDPFAASDPAITKSLSRFAKLEQDYPDHFIAFYIVTNHRFRSAPRDTHCLQYLIDEIRNRDSITRLRKDNPVREYITSICERHKNETEHLVSAMRKLSLVDYGSDLEKSYQDLRDVTGALPQLSTQAHSTICRLADNLMFLVYLASSLRPGGRVADLYILTSDFPTHRNNLLLQGKLITKDIVAMQLAEWTTDQVENLLVSHRLVVEGVPPGYDVLTEKLERGGLQTARINKMKDYKASMESLYLRWRYKFSLEEANRRLSHLKVLVEDDCIESQIAAAERTPTTYAPQMYSNLRTLLAQHSGAIGPELFDATEHHLVGTAAILTEECLVWWSDRFDLKSR